MAHSVVLAGLVAELVGSLTELNPAVKARELKQCRDHALRAFRGQQYARTNQFEVEKTFDGLLEKFQILHREDLAEALNARLRRLSVQSNKWTPDILSLLLQLSDRPVNKTDVNDLQRLRKAESLPQLTWDEIIADDPLDEEDVWKDIDYTAHGSSDEDSFELSDEESSDDTPITITTEYNATEAAQAYVVTPDLSTVHAAEKSQQRLKAAAQARDDISDTDHDPISELMLIRESIMMLRGLPTTLFKHNPTTLQFKVCSKVHLVDSSSTSVGSILQQMTQLSTSLQSLRSWADRPQTIPVLQTLHANILAHLDSFARLLTDVDLGLMRSVNVAVVSLISIHTQVQAAAMSLRCLHDLTAQLGSGQADYRCLELLCERVNLAQLTGESSLFEDLGRTLFSCLGTYLRPLQRWMEDGELDPEDGQSLIVELSRPEGQETAWHDRFGLRTLASGEVDAPSFLQSMCKRILNAGKNVNLMRELGCSTEPRSRVSTEHQLSFDALKGSDDGLLSPFAEVFSIALSNWVSSHHSYSSAMIRTKLVQDYGLWRSLDALEYLYLARDGSLMQNFVDSITDKIQRRLRTWNDRFVVTDTIHDIYRKVEAIDLDSIGVASTRPKKQVSKLQQLASIRFSYRLHWSIGGIIVPSSFPTYQKICTLNIQLCYLERLLQSAFLDAGVGLPPTHTTRAAGALRFRLNRFVAIFLAYIRETVIQVQVSALRQRLDKAEDIDEMVSIHTAHIKRLEAQALLSKNVGAIRTAIMQVFEMCVTFCETQSQLEPRNRASSLVAERHRRRRSAMRYAGGVSESDVDGAESTANDSEEEDYDADVEGRLSTAAKLTGTYSEKVAKMSTEFEKLTAFIINGLRGVARAGGEACYEMLAERLS